MKLYKITLKSRYGEPLIVTVTASSLYEAIKKVNLEPGWSFSEYSVIGSC